MLDFSKMSSPLYEVEKPEGSLKRFSHYKHIFVFSHCYESSFVGISIPNKFLSIDKCGQKVHGFRRQKLKLFM